MSHTNMIEQRLQALEELHKRSIGDDDVFVCRTCYAEKDDKGCPCGRLDWALVQIVIIDLALWLDDLQQEAHEAHT